MSPSLYAPHHPASGNRHNSLVHDVSVGDDDDIGKSDADDDEEEVEGDETELRQHAGEVESREEHDGECDGVESYGDQ